MKSFNGLVPSPGRSKMIRQISRLRIINLLSVALVALGVGIGARGEAPSGSFQYALSAQNDVPLWNFSGAYVFPYGSVQLHQDSKGRIVASYDALGLGSVGLVGSFSGAGTNLKLRLRSEVGVPELLMDESTGYLGYPVSRKDTLSLTFDANTGALTGTDRVNRMHEEIQYGSPDSFWEGNKTFIKRTTTVSIQTIVMTVPESTDGNWTLSLEIVPAGDKLSGTAAITFSNGDIFRFQILGRYSTKTGKTTLLLKGDGVDKGASLSLFISRPNMEIESMHGTVGGQRIRFTQT
jgi:hypothetical protein